MSVRSVLAHADAAIDTSKPSGRASYDSVAQDYDRAWSAHVREPQQRLTSELALRSGLRCVDLACGTGVDTLEMLYQTAPGEMVAVDCSRKMLEVAEQRARGAGLTLRTHCESVECFLKNAGAAAFDVVSMRFCLGYLDAHSTLPRAAALLRPGGRLGVLTLLASSAPQAYASYEEMTRQFGIGPVPRSGPASLQALEAQLGDAGYVVQTSWLSSFRLAFASGEELAAFLRHTGLATHPLLTQLDDGVRQALWRRFAAAVESHRQADGSIPLDFELAGAVASPHAPSLNLSRGVPGA